MPEFNNINYSLDDGEKFALICGMLAGMRLQNKVAPPDNVIVRLKPIGVGGTGTIGLMASDIEYNHIDDIRVPVFTHDVDIDYSGFSIRVKYDTSRIVINSIESGDFGPITGTKIENGTAYTRCMLDKGKFVSKPVIVCWLNCHIVNPPTKNNPIKVDFLTSTGYDPNYCSLLTWVLNDIDHNYYSYFITPTQNIGFKITSEDEEDKNESTLDEDSGAASKASPSQIKIGRTIVFPDRDSYLPIYTNANELDNKAYNKFSCRVSIDAANAQKVIFKGCGAGEGWKVDYSHEVVDSKLYISVHGERSKIASDSCTPAYFIFRLSPGVEKLNATVHCTFGSLTGEREYPDIALYDGWIGWPITEKKHDDDDDDDDTKIIIPIPPDPDPDHPNYNNGGYIWSGSDQTIWINTGSGIKYPIRLKPGWNQIWAEIPVIVPKDDDGEHNITIEAPGYILIPGGFTIEVVTSPDAPLGLSSPRIVDNVEFGDGYFVEKYTPSTPIDLDDIIDKIDFSDMAEVSVEDINIIVKDYLDELGFDDAAHVEIYVPEVPVDADNIVESATLSDDAEVHLTNLNIISTDESEQLNLGDDATIEAL